MGVDVIRNNCKSKKMKEMHTIVTHDFRFREGFNTIIRLGRLNYENLRPGDYFRLKAHKTNSKAVAKVLCLTYVPYHSVSNEAIAANHLKLNGDGLDDYMRKIYGKYLTLDTYVTVLSFEVTQYEN